MSPEGYGSEAEWQIWYQDTFDRECPRQVEVSGQGLLEGLIELWARHLFETVQADGQQGFSRFNLWWNQEKRSVQVVGDWGGQVRLRGWVFGGERRANRGYLEEGDRALLYTIAATHRDLIQGGGTSEEILAAAKASLSRKDFEQQLLNRKGLDCRLACAQPGAITLDS